MIWPRIFQACQTLDFLAGPAPVLSDRFRGLPVLDHSKCPADCSACVAACPTNAITQPDKLVQIDLGRCLFCTDCMEACPTGAVEFSNSFSLATRNRADLIVRGGDFKLAEPLEAKRLRVLGRSLKLRHVSAGGSGACESQIEALNNVVYDLSRFGIEFVNSPRHADGLLITGPVTASMKPVLLQTYAAIASPKVVIVVGTEAISGAPFDQLASDSADQTGVEGLLPIDLYIPGAPPHPLTILDGLLRFLAVPRVGD
jgi:Ni,Fe-hydrogenase III small subunit/NAD-dependent dihydropyrimidine dehydrogenase PreA subunit